MKPDDSWMVVEKGVNGKPFLWKNQATDKYVMIDIFEARSDRCYEVLAVDVNPLENDDAKGATIGRGCSDKANWIEAYEKAKRIADRYMSKH